MRLFLYGAGVSQFVLGAVVMVLNIVFIYDGMNSGWYGDQGGLRVVSIGEGIIAGFLYLGLGGAVLAVLGRPGHHLKALLGLEASMLLLSLTLTIANGCQL